MSNNKEKLVFHLNEIFEEPLDWVWPGWMAAGKPALFDGDPNLGKSLVNLDFAARLTRARPMPDGYVPPEAISVVLVGHEDGLRDTVLPRLKAAGADLRRVHVFAGRARDGVWSGLPTFPDDCDLLKETVVETSARLVILDPLMASLSARFCSLNDQMVRQALGPLAQLAQETRAGMNWVRHLNKGGTGQRALYRGSGSIAIIGSARTAFLVGRAPGDEDLRVLACTKSNLSEPPPSLGFRITRSNDGQPIIAWTGPVDLSADDLVVSARVQHGQTLDEAKDFLGELLAAGPCSWQEVHRKAQEAGINARTLRRAKVELGIVSTAKHADGLTHWHWSLPEAAGAPLEPWGEQRAVALQAAEEESRRFLQELCEQQKSAVRSP